MTRRSERELERALEDLGGDDPQTVHEWVSQQFKQAITTGEVRTCFSGEAPHGGDAVLVSAPRERATFGIYLYVDREAIPDWIDIEADLPVREGGAGRP